MLLLFSQVVYISNAIISCDWLIASHTGFFYGGVDDRAITDVKNGAPEIKR
jgi:hypothetical protein